MPDRLVDAMTFASRLSVTYGDWRSPKPDRPKAKGLCPICGRTKKLVNDHDHAIGYNRDWICGTCNSGLGMFLDDPGILEAARLYLERHRQLHEREQIVRHQKPSEALA